MTIHSGPKRAAAVASEYWSVPTEMLRDREKGKSWPYRDLGRFLAASGVIEFKKKETMDARSMPYVNVTGNTVGPGLLTESGSQP